MRSMLIQRFLNDYAILGYNTQPHYKSVLYKDKNRENSIWGSNGYQFCCQLGALEWKVIAYYNDFCEKIRTVFICIYQINNLIESFQVSMTTQAVLNFYNHLKLVLKNVYTV